MIGWINHHITHNRDRDGDFGIRVLIHIPVGLLMGIPVLGWGLIQLFLKYERNEDLHTEDEAWKDIYGGIVGYVITQVLFLALVLAWLHSIGWF